MPRVSVVIPVWGDYEKYLPECLESVKNQTFTDYEIVVVRDCTDLPTARNKGIERSTGDYILPLDVDDMLKEDYLKKTVDKGDIVTTAHYGAGNKREIPASEIHLADMKMCNVVIACSLFKRKVWEDIGGYDETLKWGYEDWDFWLRAMLAGYKIEVVNEPLYHYRKRQDSMVNTIKNRDELIKYIQNKKYVS